MTDPLFWLVLSFLFVSVSLTIVLVVAIPAFRELARAARSAEKLFDTLYREFPPTLEAIRLTGVEITSLTDDVSEGVQSAGQVVKQVDQSLTDVRKQAKKVQSGTRSLMVGMKAAWRTFTRSQKPPTQRRSDYVEGGIASHRLPASTRPELNLNDSRSQHRATEELTNSAGLSNRELYELEDYYDEPDETIAKLEMSPPPNSAAHLSSQDLAEDVWETASDRTRERSS